MIAESYILTSDESTTYAGQNVPTTTLFPDVIFKRDDSLTIENVGNLEPPEILESGNQAEGYGREGGFTYNVDDGYTVELDNVSNTVDQSTFLKNRKYRIDSDLYYERSINVDGLLTAFDPNTQNIQYVDYWNSHKFGITIFDARFGFKFNDHVKISLVINNLFNKEYALRPMKIERPRTTAIQLVCNF